MTTIAIFGLAFISNAQVPSYLPSNGLVGWWPFNGNANDESGNGINGTVNGATLTNDRFGNANKAYDFNGFNNFIEGSCNNFPQDSLTVSVWFYSNNISITPSTFNGILGYGGGNGSYPANCGKSFNMWFNNPGTSSNNAFEIQQHCNINVVTYTYGSNNPNGNWHNWIVTFNTGETKFYLDGDLVYASTTSPSNNIIISGKKFIYGAGVNFDGLTNYSSAQWTGKLDDIGIWNRALTQEEITSLYSVSPLVINEDLQSNLFSVYPNPAQNQINVNTDDKLVGSVYTIYDNIGKVVKTGKLNSVNTTIELNDLSGGFYFFRVGDNFKQTFKVIKE